MNIALPTKGWKFFVGFVHGFPMLSWPLDDCMLSSSDLLTCEGDKMKKKNANGYYFNLSILILWHGAV